MLMSAFSAALQNCKYGIRPLVLFKQQWTLEIRPGVALESIMKTYLCMFLNHCTIVDTEKKCFICGDTYWLVVVALNEMHVFTRTALKGNPSAFQQLSSTICHLGVMHQTPWKKTFHICRLWEAFVLLFLWVHMGDGDCRRWWQMEGKQGDFCTFATFQRRNEESEATRGREETSKGFFSPASPCLKRTRPEWKTQLREKVAAVTAAKQNIFKDRHR